MHEVLVNRLGGLSLPRKSVVRLTDRPDMILDVYRGRKTTIQQICPCQSLVPYETTTIITDKFSFTLIGKLPTEATPPFSFIILLSVVQD